MALHGLEPSDCHSQGYDTGTNRKDAHTGVQADILYENPKAFHVPCGIHNLSSFLAGVMKSLGTAVNFFGTLGK
jgi:hypothetical protein